MITYIPHQQNLLDLLKTVAEKSGHKAALANGKFKQDYGNVLYLTQNRIRANQLNLLLAQEVAQTHEKTIIPPAVLPYTAGFVRLASLVKFGYVDSLNVCRYTDEWFNLFLYEVAKKVVPDAFFADEFGLMDNKRANLAKDFRVFIRDVVLWLKTKTADSLYADLERLSETERLFLEAYHAYREEEKNFSNADNQFMHPLQAYEDLYARVREGAADLNKVIIVEDEDLLEPLFREILKKINCPVYVLQDTAAAANAYREKTDLYHFMTPLDEAEFVGWRIKSLLVGGTSGTDIGVVCADRAAAEVLEAVFKRMDIAGEQRLPLAANGYYRLVKMLFALIYREEGASLSAEALFADEKSKFKLGWGFHLLRRMLTKKGLKSQLSPAEGLLESITEFIGDEDHTVEAKYKEPSAYEKDKATLCRLKELLEKQNPRVSEIAEYALNDTKDKALINDIMAALYELDENLKTETDRDEFLKKAHTLFGVLDGRELNTRREALALEQAPAADKTEDDWEMETNYSFSVAPAEWAKTLRVKHLFLCGFNAGADKTGLLCYPNALAEKLELPTLAEKKVRAAESVEYALNYADETAVTYGYLTLEGRENGQAALIQLLGQVLPTEKQHIGEDNHLLKSYGDESQKLIDAMPDPSWTGAQEAVRKEKGLKKFTEEVLFAQTKTCGQLLEEIIRPDTQGRRAIAAKQFADFIICPSKFFFTLLAKHCGMETADAEGIQRMSKGTFWHKVFEDGATQDIFYGQGETKIKEALEIALNGVMQEEDISKFDVNDKDDFLAQAKEEVLPLFARNEAARQEKYGLCAYEGLEEKFTYCIPNCTFDIHGKVDRKDKSNGEKIFFWDYKTGNPKADPLKFYKEKGKKGEKYWELEKDENSLQLALYMYGYAKARPATQKEPPPLCAGNIFINGKDNMGTQDYDTKLEGALDKQMETFVRCLKEPLSELPKENKVKKDPCKYCDFKAACKIISKIAGGKND